MTQEGATSSSSHSATSTSTPSYIWQVAQARRLGHLLNVKGLTNPPAEGETSRSLNTAFFDFSIPIFLAWRDINQRHSPILPHLQDLLEGCDFYWTMETRDTQFSRMEGVKQLLQAGRIHTQGDGGEERKGRQHEGQRHLTSDPSSTSLNATATQPPFALSGPIYSSVTQQVNIIASALGMVTSSGCATSPDLDSSPLFARTIPTNQEDARAVMTYYSSLKVDRVACVFVLEDAYGNAYNAALQQEASVRGITLLNFAIQFGNENQAETIDQTMQAIEQSQVKYIFAIVVNQWRTVVQAAYSHGLMGKQTDFVWFFSEQLYIEDEEGQELIFEDDDAHLAQALTGAGFAYLHYEPNPIFDRQLDQVLHNETQRQQYIDTFADPNHIVHNHTFQHTASRNHYQLLMYDATIALGLAACQTPGLFTGDELFETLLQVNFTGASGPIAFNSNTHSPPSDNTRFGLENAFLGANANSNTTRLKLQQSAIIQGDHIQIRHPFIFPTNSTLPPPDKPPQTDHNYNLIPQSVQITGYCVATATILFAIICMAWTVLNKHRFIVNAAQPVFLIQLCVGAIIMATAIYPSGLQTAQDPPPQAYHSACQSIPWLLFLGFVTAGSALLSKVWRLDKLMGASSEMKRIQVAPLDVMKPFCILLTWNTLQLTLTTILSPLQYTRYYDDDSMDRFGRPVQSYAACRPTNDWIFVFLSLACAANLGGFLFAAVICYKVRHISFYFSETFYLAISMGSFCETLLLGAPLLILTREVPTSFFLVGTALISICCLCFLLPVFVPKYTYRESSYADAREVDAMNISRQSNHSAASRSSHHSRQPCHGPQNGSQMIGSSGFSTIYSESSIPGLMCIRRREIRGSVSSNAGSSRPTTLSNVSGLNLVDDDHHLRRGGPGSGLTNTHASADDHGRSMNNDDSGSFG